MLNYDQFNALCIISRTMGNKQFVCVRIQGRESLFLKEWATKLRFYRTNENKHI